MNMDTSQLIEEIYQVKNEILSKRAYQKSLTEEEQELHRKLANVSRLGEFNEDSYELKKQLDTIAFKHLLDKANINEEAKESLLEAWDYIQKAVKWIYESLNIEPTSVFSKSLLTEDEESQSRSVDEWIAKQLDVMFYSKPVEVRVEEIKEDVKSLLPDVSKNITEDMKYAVRTALFTKILESLVFPPLTKGVIEGILEDETFNQVFDLEKVQQVYDTTREVLRDIAKVIVQ